MVGMGEINGHSVHITHHAVQRMLEMELEASEFKDILVNPDEISDSHCKKGHLNYRKGDYSVGVCIEKGVINVITIVYATRAAWLRASLAGKLPEGREYREDINLPRF